MPLTIRLYCLSACLALDVGSRPLPAQSPDTAATAQPGFCWRARPLPRCKIFPITEISVLVPLGTSRTSPDPVYGYGDYADFTSGLRWTIGTMRNESPTRAQGFVVSVGIDSDGGPSPAIEWRNRLWLGSARSSADFSFGYSQKDVFIRPETPGAPGDNATARGLTASGALLPIDLLGIVARADLLFTRGKTHYGFSVGAQSGSYGSAIVLGIMAAWVALVFAALSGGDF